MPEAVAPGRPLVLVHGLWWGRPSMAPLRRRARGRGYDARVFHYHTHREAPERAAERLARFAAALGEPAGYIGHSLGGLMLALAAGGLPPGRIVMVGSPIGGSAAARRVAGWGPARHLLGRAGDLLQAGATAWPAEREVGMIAGDRPFGVGRVTGALEDGGDGTVALAETRHPALAAHCVLPVTHTGMLFSAAVAEAAFRFVETGAF